MTIYFVYEGYDVRQRRAMRFYWTTDGYWSPTTEKRLEFKSHAEKDIWLAAHPRFGGVKVVEET